MGKETLANTRESVVASGGCSDLNPSGSLNVPGCRALIRLDKVTHRKTDCQWQKIQSRDGGGHEKNDYGLECHGQDGKRLERKGTITEKN